MYQVRFFFPLEERGEGKEMKNNELISLLKLSVWKERLNIRIEMQSMFCGKPYHGKSKINIKQFNLLKT